MKTQKSIYWAFIALLFIFACNGAQQKEGADKEEVTYQEVIDAVYSDSGERIEWHGEAIDISAKLSSELYLNGLCGKEDCGEQYFIKNNDSTRTMEVIVNSKFLIEDQDDIGHVRKYVIGPGVEEFVGCSAFCHELESFKILNEVVGAKFL